MVNPDLEILKSLHPSVQRAIKRKWENKESFRDVQRLAIPKIIAKKNCLIVSSTASGKTEAAFLPVLSNVYDSAMENNGIHIIFIAPLRALLNDLEERLAEWLFAATDDIKLFKWHGDVSAFNKNKQRKNPEAILLTTPESLDVMLATISKSKEDYFRNVMAVIIDEAHYFASDSRGAQLASSLERLQLLSTYTFQRIGLSATVGDPELVSQWLKGSSAECEIISSIGNSKILTIEHILIDEDGNDYENELQTTLSNIVKTGKSIVFGNSKRDVEMTARLLEKSGISTMVHHGSISKMLREEAEIQMRDNKENAVISATSTLELGIDIGDLTCVVQKDTLPSVNSYLQRIGRAGRKDGRAHIVLLTRTFEDFILNIAMATLGSEGYNEPLRPSRYRFDIIFQQLLLEIYGNYGISRKTFFQKIKNTYSFQNIEYDQFEVLLQFWKKENYLLEDDGILSFGPIIEKKFSHKNYMELYSVFDVNEYYTVFFNKEEIGYLESWFAFSLRADESIFQLAGRKWTVIDVIPELKSIIVRPTGDALPPSWRGGSKFQIEYEVARRFQDILDRSYDVRDQLSSTAQSVLKNYLCISKHSSIIEGELGIIKHGKELWIETYAGTMITEVLTFALMDAFPGIKISTRFYRIEIELNKLKGNVILEALQNFIFTLTVMSDSEWILFLKNHLEELKYSRFSDFIPDEFSVLHASEAFYVLKDLKKFAIRLGSDCFLHLEGNNLLSD